MKPKLQMKSIPALLLLVLLCFSACRYSGEWKTATATTYDGQQSFSLSFPDYVSEEKEHKLHKSAPMQYCNYFRNFYGFADDTLSDNYRSVADLETKRLIALLGKPLQIDTQSLQINGLPAFSASYSGDVGISDIVERIYYRLVFVQGKNRVYRITLWVWDKNRNKYTQDFEKITGSFLEL